MVPGPRSLVLGLLEQNATMHCRMTQSAASNSSKMKIFPLAVSWIYKGFDPVMIVSVHLCLSNNWKIHLTLALRNHIPEYLQKCANPAMLLQQRGEVYNCNPCYRMQKKSRLGKLIEKRMKRDQKDKLVGQTRATLQSGDVTSAQKCGLHNCNPRQRMWNVKLVG